MLTVGLDLSLTHSGYAVIDDEGTLLASGVIKSKPVGDLPVSETRRIVKIAEDLMEQIDETLPGVDPDLVVIEGLAFMARNTSALVQLAGLNYIVRILLDEFKWPFLIVAPSTLKKFITGKGNSDKNVIMMEVYKQYGHTFLDDNEADAFCLAAIGMAALGKPLRKQGNAQKEVTGLLRKQLAVKK